MFLWESRCEDCVCESTTFKCNTQRARREVSLISHLVQFDSDYSVGDGASIFFFEGMGLSEFILNRILLICTMQYVFLVQFNTAALD